MPIKDIVKALLKKKIVGYNLLTNEMNLTSIYKPEDEAELSDIVEVCTVMDNNCNLNWLNVSHITDMSELFTKTDPHNIDIS